MTVIDLKTHDYPELTNDNEGSASPRAVVKACLCRPNTCGPTYSGDTGEVIDPTIQIIPPSHKWIWEKHSEHMADSPSLSLLKNNNEHVGGYIGFVNKLRTITLRILLQTDAECWEDPEEGSSRAENVCFAVSDMLTYSQWDEVTDEEINLYLTDPDYDEDAE